MGLFRCLTDNSWDGVQGYERGVIYNFASNPSATLFEEVLDGDTTPVKSPISELPAWKDIESDYHVDVDVQFDKNVEFETLIAKSLELDTGGPLKPYKAGQLQFNPNTNTFLLDSGIDGVRNDIGEELWYTAINNTGSLIPNGTPVYSGGVDNGVLEMNLASSSSPFTSLSTLGLVTSDIADGETGKVTYFGSVKDFDTSGFPDGSTLYLSNTPGEIVTTTPLYPHEIVILGNCLFSDATAGEAIVTVNIYDRASASRDYSFTSRGVGAGVYYSGGFYEAPASDATLSNLSPTVSYGTVNNPYAAHAFAVFGGAGIVVGVGKVGLRVNGDSITDGGVLTIGDTQDITDDIESVALDDYIETNKKWLGSIEYELYVVSGSPTAYSVDFNYGYAKYEDIGNNDFTLVDFEVVGLAGANDTLFDLEVIHHKTTGWTYSAAAFIPGPPAVSSWAGDMAPYDNLANGQNFAYKRDNLDTFIDGDGSEGAIIRITAGANNSVQFMDLHVGGVREGF